MNDLPDLRARLERRLLWLEIGVALLGAVPMSLLIVAIVVVR